MFDEFEDDPVEALRDEEIFPDPDEDFDEVDDVDFDNNFFGVDEADVEDDIMTIADQW
jgi:hypothetical protein